MLRTGLVCHLLLVQEYCWASFHMYCAFCQGHRHDIGLQLLQEGLAVTRHHPAGTVLPDVVELQTAFPRIVKVRQPVLQCSVLRHSSLDTLLKDAGYWACLRLWVPLF